MAYLCIAPACGADCSQCNRAISPQTAREYAVRYAWLRAQHWDTAPLAVVAEPRRAVKLGHDLPSGARLDEAIDTARMSAANVGGEA